MKIVALIPYWNNYIYPNQSINGLDKCLLSGKSLINYPIILANKIKKIDQTYIFTNDLIISHSIQKQLKFEILPRNKNLDSQKTSIEDIVDAFLEKIDCDFILLLHSNSPFLEPQTISECINKVISGQFDSSFLAKKEQKFVWFNGKRLNYEPLNGTPSLSDIEPVIIESSAAYFFSKNTFNSCRTRIGREPFIKEIGPFEGMVISSKEDFKIAEFLLDSGFFID